MANVHEVLTAAVRDFTERGFVSQEQLDGWMAALRAAIAERVTPRAQQQEWLRWALGAIYTRMVERAGVLRNHPGAERFTLARIAPELRAELDRRILASTNLIKLNRDEAIDKTLRRFAGWASSVPAGGTTQADKGEVKTEVGKALAALPFIERRVLVDQGHKLTAAISATVAEGGGAIAARWFSHWRQSNYDYREDHKERDEKVYVIRNTWAINHGYIKAVDGYTDDITSPGEEVFCRCNYTYLYNLRQVKELLTKKGELALQSAKIS